MKGIICVLAFVTMSVGAVAEPRTWTGHISDSMCGAKHASMGGKKMTDRECTDMCVKAGARYVFVTDDGIYQIANQRDPGLAAHAGHTVAITGELEHDTLTVSKIEMAKSSKK